MQMDPNGSIGLRALQRRASPGDNLRAWETSIYKQRSKNDRLIQSFSKVKVLSSSTRAEIASACVGAMRAANAPLREHQGQSATSTPLKRVNARFNPSQMTNRLFC